MSLLETYSGGMATDIMSINDSSSSLGECTLAINMMPGEWVKHRWYDRSHQGYGILVAVGCRPNLLNKEEDFVTILWSVEPQNPFNSGYVYAPYVPLQVTPTVIPPEDFAHHAPRYFSHKLDKSYFGAITVKDIK